MNSLRRAVTCAVLLAMDLVQSGAQAQVPPHQPGTICFTPSFWCWMQRPGIPGQTCLCATQWGQVRGVIG